MKHHLNYIIVTGFGGLLLCGGHGSGKTSIAKTVSYSLERDLQTLACKLSNEFTLLDYFIISII